MDILSMPKIKQDEYLRRNILLCKSIGVITEAESVLCRLNSMRNPPKWLIKCMNEIIKRAEPVRKEMAYHRGEVTHPIDR